VTVGLGIKLKQNANAFAFCLDMTNLGIGAVLRSSDVTSVTG